MTKQELEWCISEYGKDIYSFCKYLTRNLTEAEDLYQDTFLTAVELIEKIDCENNPKSYLLSITLRIWKNKQRKFTWRNRIAQVQSLVEEKESDNGISADPTPEEIIIRMEKEFDDLLRRALSPDDEPDFWLNQKILNRTKEQNVMIKSKKKISVAILIMALMLCLGSVTVYAAWKYLSASEVAQSMQDMKMSTAFTSGQAYTINETQNYGKYRVTLLSIVSGESLSSYPHFSNDAIMTDRTYAVIAIENVNGTPMPDTSETAYGKLDFFASPLISGYNPIIYNIASMNGNYTDMTEDGVLYRLLECDNVEEYADQELYLCVSEGVFYEPTAYIYDEVTGKISRNESYHGLNALFKLPLDKRR